MPLQPPQLKSLSRTRPSLCSPMPERTHLWWAERERVSPVHLGKGAEDVSAQSTGTCKRTTSTAAP